MTTFVSGTENAVRWAARIVYASSTSGVMAISSPDHHLRRRSPARSTCELDNGTRLVWPERRHCAAPRVPPAWPRGMPTVTPLATPAPAFVGSGTVPYPSVRHTARSSSNITMAVWKTSLRPSSQSSASPSFRAPCSWRWVRSATVPQ